MEKKLKHAQSTAKGAAGDAKKSQDVSSGKAFPKTSRRREPSTAAGYPKCEQARKTSVQKTKSFDKRPKPKGQYHGLPKEDTKVVEDDLAEHGSVMVQGSKKQNLNHLLNFHYAPRDVQGGSRPWNGESAANYQRHSNRWLPPVQRHKYNKEQFLQASCQFVVAADGDYSLYLANPDALVDWKFVEEIRLHSTERLSCPICLYPPVAGKMTRCGHVYCWPCILHYLSLSDKTWRKCPICYESIHKVDLKSVVEVTQSALNIGDKVTLRLMRREKGSLLAAPVDVAVTPTTFSTVSQSTDVRVYSKLLLAKVADVLDIVERERRQLKYELMEDAHSPESCFIQQALDESHQRRQQLLQSVESALETSAEETCAETDRKEETSAEQSETKDDQGTSEKDAEKIEPQTSTAKYFYFYQAEDGQHVYLHAMNVKMLEMQYGNLENCPRQITGRLLEKEAGSFTDELRRRMRYLCHLPITCQFEIAEIELAPPIVTAEVLENFRTQLEVRQKKRRRREREERKRDKKITEEENKRMGRYPAAKVQIESRRHFPQWHPEPSGMSIPTPPESAGTTSVASSPSQSILEDLGSNATDANNWSVGTELQNPSFAEMLRTTGKRVGASAWPSASNSTARSNDPDAEGYISPPSYNASFEDALAQALKQVDLESGARNSCGESGGKKKKKKKSKPTVLFATSMARSP